MDKLSPHSLTYVLRGYECGYGGSLKILPLLNLLQESAGANADALGFGVARLNAERRTWMLSRVAIEIDALPRETEAVRVETWPAGTERLFALRDFVLRAADGRSLVRAVFAYLIVDVDARRPLRPENYFGPLSPKVDLPHPIPDHVFKVPQTEGFEHGFDLRASPRHIDINGHVNNTHIIDWLVDAVPPDRRGGGLSTLRVEFLQEVVSGNDLCSFWAPLPESPGSSSSLVVELRRGAETVARALSSWRPA